MVGLKKKEVCGKSSPAHLSALKPKMLSLQSILLLLIFTALKRCVFLCEFWYVYAALVPVIEVPSPCVAPDERYDGKCNGYR